MKSRTTSGKAGSSRWGTSATRRAASSLESVPIGMPSSEIVPRSGTRRPSSARTSVLLPLPLGPTIAVIAPRGASSETPSTAARSVRG